MEIYLDFYFLSLEKGDFLFMKTKIKFFFIVVVVISMALQPTISTAEISEAVSYLQSQPQDAWTTMALAASGQVGVPIDHLTSVSGTTATDYAKTILALAAVGENPATFGNLDYIAKLKTYHADNQMGDSGLLNDDIWSILALASVGQVDSTEAVAAKNFILANQNVDGGWGYAIGVASDTNDTAAAIMALVEAGVSPSDSVITNAVNYLATAQNDDGGFGYQPGSDSDSGSDSWVISALYKIGQQPTSWSAGDENKTPIDHLESLQDVDGGFWWVTEGMSEWNNKAMTPYAVIALSEKSYPVGYYQTIEEQNPGTYHLLIEDSSNTICDIYVSGTTAMDLLENAAKTCQYSYNITEESFGLYLRGINEDEAEGLIGWLYFVNYISAPVGAADYILEDGDAVLFYYGQWGWSPTRLSVSDDELDSGENLSMTAEYFDGEIWLPLAGAAIKGGDQNYITNSSGQVTTVLPDGYYNLYIDQESFVRSQKVEVDVGEGVNQNVGLTVEIGQRSVAGSSIALVVDVEQINFGYLQPGQSANQSVILSNEGTVDLTVGASISGDTVFTSGIKINDSSPNQYSESLNSDQSKATTVSLAVPESYLGAGIKSGELIFWASSR